MSSHRTATVERFSPTLLAHAIAAPTPRDTKAMARAKPTRKKEIEKPFKSLNLKNNHPFRLVNGFQ